ncbi:putative leader peptide [Streptomyces sp. NPDC054847]|uniref:putative leader peptide n=1 Tax=Streptomyces sp. OZ13 TaxID=3452210 RepID=UPI003F890B43
MARYSACETGSFPALTWPIRAASLMGVSQSANFTARRHVDLRRHASALCLFCRRGR